MPRTLVIEEAGSCHDGNFQKALSLVDVAADAGADAVKLQYWSDPDQLADRRRVPEYYREIYRKYTVPLFWLEYIAELCKSRDIAFALTAYLPQDVDTIAKYASILKIASFEAEAADIVAAYRPYRHRTDKQIIVSLGMGASRSLWLTEPTRNLKFLRCVSAYPAPHESLELSRLQSHLYDGLSDHTSPLLTYTGALAVAAGAEVIEAHVKLPTTNVENPDAPHAMTPLQFIEYVRNIRFAEQCVGDTPHLLEPLECEMAMAQYRVRST